MMTSRMFTNAAGTFAGLLISGLAGTAADSIGVRGTVARLDGSTLTIDTREGKPADVKLADGWKISGIDKASIGDIKVGDFVGVASAPTADGSDGALEVLIFPAAMKGAGEGSRPWDLTPNSSMTNGTVADQVTGVDGPTLTVTYNNGQEKKFAIPAGTPVVTIATAVPEDLKPGAAIFLRAERAPDGNLTSSRVVVGNHGVAPPM